MAQLTDKSVIVSSLWMIVISLALFFLPAVNGVIGGAVGGYKAGSVGRGLMAGILPSVVVGILLWIAIAALDAPIIGFFSGVAVGFWALLSSVGLLLGAALGGAFAPDRPSAR